MARSMSSKVVMQLVVVVAMICAMKGGGGGMVEAGGKDPCPGGMATVAMGMASCLPATKDTNAKPDAACCAKLLDMAPNPACLCACLTSPLARAMGVNPIVALSIPKRCAIDSRPVGYRCAGGSVP